MSKNDYILEKFNSLLELKDQVDCEYDESLRPSLLKDYVGQNEIKEMLNIYIKTALKRNEPLDHVLLYGPPGLGKTTLANIIANEMGTNFRIVSAPSIHRVGDLASILVSLEPGDVLFIDEIHRLPRVLEEALYSAMEDFRIDLIIGKDSTSQVRNIDLVAFTLVGATTRYGDISSPLRDRFGIVNGLKFYNILDLKDIIKRTAKIFSVSINDDAAIEIAKRSRGTPRIANRLFRRVRDYSQFKYENNEIIDLDITNEALSKQNVDNVGLDYLDIKYMKTIIEGYHGGPVGLNAISSTLGEDSQTIEDIVEPYLLQIGFIIRSSRGRCVTDKGYAHFGLNKN